MLTSTIPSSSDSLLASLDALVEDDFTRLTETGHAELLRVVSRAESKLCAVKMKLLAVVDKMGTASACGAAGTGQWAAKVVNGDQAAVCERPFAWCEPKLHHRRPWSRGGRTDLRDAVPLCHFHHQRIHDTGFGHRYLPDGSIRFTRRT